MPYLSSSGVISFYICRLSPILIDIYNNELQRYYLHSLHQVILLGEQNVGKTSLQRIYSDPKSAKATTLSIEPTIGVEFNTKVVSVEGSKVELHIWDTAGQERYRAITRSHFRHSQAVLLLFDVTNQSSFDSLERWLLDVKAHLGEEAVIMLVANKTDLAEARVISPEVARLFASQNHLLFYEVSAKTRHNVDPLFQALAKQVLLNHKDSPAELTSVRLTNKHDKDSVCCS